MTDQIIFDPKFYEIFKAAEQGTELRWQCLQLQAMSDLVANLTFGFKKFATDIDESIESITHIGKCLVEVLMAEQAGTQKHAGKGKRSRKKPVPRKHRLK